MKDRQDITRYGFKGSISDVGRASIINQRSCVKESSICKIIGYLIRYS